jgi:hypothetical protein
LAVYGLKSAAPLTAKNENQKQALWLPQLWHAHRPADRFCWYWQVDAGCIPGCNATEGEGSREDHPDASCCATGKTVGLLPGEIEEKMAPYFRQTLIHLRKFLGNGNYFENKKIEMFPVEYARGNSFENCIVIAEEAQNYTAEEFEMMFTRLGEGAR